MKHCGAFSFPCWNWKRIQICRDERIVVSQSSERSRTANNSLWIDWIKSTKSWNIRTLILLHRKYCNRCSNLIVGPNISTWSNCRNPSISIAPSYYCHSSRSRNWHEGSQWKSERGSIRSVDKHGQENATRRNSSKCYDRWDGRRYGRYYSLDRRIFSHGVSWTGWIESTYG